MPYNLTLTANQTGVLGFIQTVNSELALGYFGVVILFVAFGIAFMTFLSSTNDAGKSLAASSFIMMTLALLLRAVDLIPNLALIVAVLMTAASLAFIRKPN